MERSEELNRRHACGACGGSCQGVVVRLTEAEVERVITQAEVLGVREPVVDGALRRVDGGCVFLDERAYCRIHSRFGASEKPSICQQFPFVAVRTETGDRLGVDPGCYLHLRSWRDGPPLPKGTPLRGSLHQVNAMEAAEEDRVVALLTAPGARVGSALAALGGIEAPGGALPEVLRARLAAWPAQVDPEVLALPGLGSTLRTHLARLVALRAPGDAALPEPWNAYALDAIVRLLRLRLLSSLGSAPTAAFLGLAGAQLAAWSARHDDDFGGGLAAWTRVLRTPGLRAAWLPDAARFGWLLGRPG